MARNDIARVVLAYPTLLEHDADRTREVVDYLLLTEVDANDVYGAFYDRSHRRSYLTLRGT
jgi:hypothetical protein